MAINQVIISGNLCDDCAKKGTAENPVVLFTVAVNDRVKSGDEWVEKPNFIDCKMFGNYAKALASSLKKGVRVAVDGRLQQDKWEDDEGNKHSKLSVRVNNLEVFAPKSDAEASKKGKKAKSAEEW